jgi:glucose uptake protein GlcU
MAKKEEKAKLEYGLGIAGFTLGIVGFLLIGIYGAIIAVLGGIFCFIQQNKKKKLRLAKIGLILNIIVFALSMFWIFIGSRLLYALLENIPQI